MNLLMTDALGNFIQWTPRTFTALGLAERDLDNAILENPDMLGLRHIGDFNAGFLDRTVDTVQDRRIRPDIVFLTSLGHLVIVESKLSSNQELKNRAALAQILDYAASISVKTPNELLDLFQAWGAPEARGWNEMFSKLFPEMGCVSDSVDRLLSNIRTRSIHLVIACDQIPPGVYDWLEAVASQEAHPFNLKAIEVVPYTQENANGDSPNPDNILFVPSDRVTTKIIARTVVEIRLPQDENAPPIQVNATTTDAERITDTVKKPRYRQRKHANMGPLVSAAARLRESHPESIEGLPLQGPIVRDRYVLRFDTRHSEVKGTFALVIWFNPLKSAEDKIMLGFVSGRNARQRLVREARAAVTERLRKDFPDVEHKEIERNQRWYFSLEELTADKIVEVTKKVIRAITDFIDFQVPGASEE